MRPLFLPFLVCSVVLQMQNSYAQEKSTEAQEVRVNTTIKHKLTEEQKVDIQNKLKALESNIQAIRTKREYILANPDQKAIAEKEGWFNDMEATEQRLLEKKKGLLETLENDKSN